MPNYYIRYEKTGLAKWISHLDFLRTFHRALRRSKVGIQYSQGFNPHALLSFALPLSVGVTSECELLEMTLEQERSPEEIVEMLNASMPSGIRVLSASLAEENIMKKIRYATYEVTGESLPTEAELETLKNMPEIVMEKKTKSGIKSVDIKPDIRSLIRLKGMVSMTLAAGNQANLKPDLVLRALETYTDFSLGDFDCHRTKILDEEGNVI